jgi:F0F1-type ATP synthase gamma subunit
MPTLNQINDQYRFTLEMHSLVQASQEISVMKIQQVRKSSLETRTYMDGVFNIFFDVRSAQHRIIQKLIENHKQFPQKETVLIVFVSTNEMFTGEIIPKVFRSFAEEVRKKNADIMVIGKVGKKLFDRTLGKKYPYTYVDMDINNPDDEQLKQLTSTFLEHARIDIYQGKYLSLAEQKPVAINLSGDTTLNEQPHTEAGENRRFLFEPSLDYLVNFFETQMTATLFRLTLNESRLANLGSRITTLESSVHNLEQQVDMLEKRRQLATRRIQNKKQLQRLSGMSRWA